MKSVFLKLISIILSIILVINSLSLPVYASDSLHGGGGGSHSESFENYEGDYTFTEFLEDVSFGFTEITKFLMFLYSTGVGVYTGSDYTTLVNDCKTYFDSMGTGDWIHVDSDNNVTYDQNLIELLIQYLTEYSNQHPEEVEKIDYQLFQTSNYEELFDDYIDIRNAFFETISVPEDLNSMENFRTMLKSQTDYSEFPHLMLGMVFQYQVSSQKTPEGNINQNFSMFQNYEKALTDSAKTPCFIGSWNADGTYRLGVYIFDNQTKSLTIDRTLTSIQQYHYVYNSEDMNACFDLTHSYKGLFSASGNAYINMTDGYWNGWGNLPDATLYPGLREKYMADFSGNVVKLSILGTPDGSIFRLFATEQDAMRYFETCADSGLNFDPNQIYSGGSITINNNGDVTINNNPPDGGNDNPVDSSEMLEKIYNRLGDILTQVKQIKWLSVADVVMDAINSFGGGIGGIVESLVDVISQVFPLCILWDVVRIFEIFEAEPVPPVFDIPIKFVWIDETVTIDLTEYEALFALLRTGEIILFLLGLFNITMSWVGRGDDVV